MDTKICISLAQYDIVWEEPDKNLLRIEKIFQGCDKTDLLILPEMFATGFSMNIHKCAETMSGKSVAWMKQVAATYQMAVCGSLIIQEEDKYFNRLVFIDEKGNIYSYDKRHLFTMGDEADNYSAGSNRLIIQYKGFRILPVICYDLRFPVWLRNRNDYDLLINVANWPAPRHNVWDILLKARAIENQCYVAGVNRIGNDANGIKYSGGSVFVDPKGKVTTASNDNEEGIITEIFSLESLQKFRKNFPVLNDADDFIIQ